jgi:hypothetical protein
MVNGGEPLALRLPEEVYALDGIEPGFPGDPFKQYGERVGEYIMGTIHQVPADMRQIALEALLNELEPGLFDRVTKRANAYAKNMGPKAALQAAIASSVSEGLVKEIIQIGKTGKVPVKSLAGLGYYDGAEALALEGLWDKIKSGVSTVGRKIKGGAKTTYSWGGTALSKIKGLTCTVMNNPLSDVAAGAAAGAYGAPPQVGVVGKQLVQGAVCPPGTQPVSQEDLATPGGLKPGLPGWVLPAGIGAAGIVALLLLRK